MKKLLLLMSLLLFLVNCNNKQAEGKNYILVEGGTFSMGDSSGEDDEDARPVSKVTLDSFYINKYEVTQKEFKELMGYNPSYFVEDNNPVERVSWFEAVIYANKLSEKEGLAPYYYIENIVEDRGKITYASISISGGKGYRLPTEAEWEYAARGGNATKDYTFSGSNNINEVAWHNENKTSPVGSKLPNELGLYDMSGNVMEWCGDWYGTYNMLDKKNPMGLSDGTFLVLRGGSWNNEENYLMVSHRYANYPDSFNENTGFRLVRSYSEAAVGEYQQAEEPQKEEYQEANILDEKYQKYVNDFKRILKLRDKKKLAEIIRYPLIRDYPVPEIKNAKDFVERYDQIFDDALINKILDSSTETDWIFHGWRGIYFADGLVWIDEEGYVTFINYSTKNEKIYKQALLDKSKNELPEALQNFKAPILDMETKEFYIRVDEMNDGSFRCCLWLLGEEMSEEPNIIMENGVVTYEGNGGNHFYSFKDNKSEYNIYVNYMRSSQEPPAILEIIDEDKTIRNQKAFIFNN